MDLFKNMQSFGEFRRFTQKDLYTQVAGEYFVILTDIRGSTKAITEGRYKAVNFVGATSIAVIANAAHPEKVPFVFGGDGATFIVNSDLLKKVRRQLVGLQKEVKQNYGFELRIGVVPVAEINKRGGEIYIARYQLSPEQPLAFFTGGGLAIADELVKSSDQYLLKDSEPSEEPNLSGLSCRWNPIPSQKGLVLSLLVMAKAKGFEGLQIYRDILQDIENAVGLDVAQAGPANLQAKNINWFAPGIVNEGRIHTQGRKKLLLIFKGLIQNFFVKFCITTGWTIGGFAPQKYIADTVQNADFKKIDDLLRMVIDCTPVQIESIRMILERYRLEGKIFFGMHTSFGALMTCLVQSAKSDHVHFIDGMDGGYTLAAIELKSQIKKLS